MTPEFARSIDPLLIRMMDVGERAMVLPFSELKVELTSAIDQVESRIGDSDQWRHAKYAICCWIDTQIIEVKEKWKDEILESHYFGTGNGHSEFFKRAEQAYRERCFDALEVFYLCFLFGFRGIYFEQEASIVPRDLPTSGVEWQKQTARRLKNVQYRPANQWNSTTSVRANREELSGGGSVVNMALLFGIAVVVVLVCAFLDSIMQLMNGLS